MKLSIIIPVLNEGPAICRSVERAWALSPHEVLVVDGGSRDGTPALAGEASAIVHVAPRGRGTQQNFGARRATGDLLLFLHADTWLPPSAAGQLAAAWRDTRVQAGAFRQKIEAGGQVYRWIERGNALRVQRFGLPYGDQGIFVRRGAFEQVNGFPDVPLMEDVLLMRRLRRLARPALLPGPLHVSARRWERHGVVRVTLRNWALLAALQGGVSPEKLARWYPLHSPAEEALPQGKSSSRA